MRFALLTGIAGLIGLAVYAGIWVLSGEKTYEECMLVQMKGQTLGMYSTADKHCARRHGVEQDVPRSLVTVTWGVVSVDHAKVEIEKSGEYKIARGEFSFAAKPCKDTTSADFKEPVEGRFLDGKSALVPIRTIIATLAVIGSGDKACMRSDNFRGTYR
jgi:hypothetical protein